MPATTAAAEPDAPTLAREAMDHLVHGNYWDPFGGPGLARGHVGGEPAGRSGRSCRRRARPGS